MKKLTDIFEKKVPVWGKDVVIPLSKVSKRIADIAIDQGNEDGDKKDDPATHKKVSIAVKQLKAAQTEIIPEKAIGMAIGMMLGKKLSIGGDLGSIISADNYIMDGHHRWAATYLCDPSAKVECTKIDLDGIALVSVLNVITKAVHNRSGNEGKGNIKDFTSKVIGKVLDDYLENGIGGEYPISSEDIAERLGRVPGANGDTMKGREIMMSNADKLPKGIMPGAPARVDMPVIKPEEVKHAAELIKSGKIDITNPFSEKTDKAIKECFVSLSGEFIFENDINEDTMKNLENINEFGPLAGSGNTDKLEELKREASKKSEKGEMVYVVQGKNGKPKLSKWFEEGKTYAGYMNGMQQNIEESLVFENMSDLELDWNSGDYNRRIELLQTANAYQPNEGMFDRIKDMSFNMLPTEIVKLFSNVFENVNESVLSEIKNHKGYTDYDFKRFMEIDGNTEEMYLKYLKTEFANENVNESALIKVTKAESKYDYYVNVNNVKYVADFKKLKDGTIEFMVDSGEKATKIFLDKAGKIKSSNNLFTDKINSEIVKGLKDQKDYDSIINESASQFAVMLTGGSVGDNNRPSNARGFKGYPVPANQDLFDKESAKAKAKSMNKYLTPGEKSHYGLKYVIVPVENGQFVNEGFTENGEEIVNEGISSYQRLPTSVIGNELYSVQKNLSSFYENLKAGNDYEPSRMAAIIATLKKIDDSARAFYKGSKEALPKEFK